MGILDLGRYKGIVFAITGFLVFIAVILAMNHSRLGQIPYNIAAAKYLAERQAQPRALYDAGLVASSQLQAGEPIEEAIESLRRAAKSYDDTIGALAQGGMIGADNDRMITLPALADEHAARLLADNAKIWSAYKTRLDPVLRFSGSPYPAPSASALAAAAQPGADPAAVRSGSDPPLAAAAALSPRGRHLRQALDELNQYGESSYAQLTRVLSELAGVVETHAARQVRMLRAIQVGGMVAATLLLGAIFFYFARNMRKEEMIGRRARKETEDILRTVNEGLFLLDKDFNLGSERSMALNAIFRREDFHRLSFDELLKQIVPEKTLKTAMDYVSLLWGERVNEKLIKSINPLSEVEVHFDNPAGGFDTHFLEFDFNRVKSAGSLSHLLVTVNDVTKRVMLARELQESQEKAQAQLDLLLRILHVEPDSLTGFLDDAEVSLKMVNSILKEPAREETAFRAKIDGIHRQVHAVKGEASALGLNTVEQRAHAFEESLGELKSRQPLSGSDFLPLVVKLDDLFNHLAQVREMLGRLVDLHQAIASRGSHSQGRGQAEAEKVDRWLNAPQPAMQAATQEDQADAGLARTLEDLALRVANSQSKQVQLHCTGLEGVPPAYRRAVKDITIQLVRNAVVHGIEEPAARHQAKKPPVGTLVVEFAAHKADGYQLMVHDDGRGLQLDRIKEAAIERGLISAAQAALLDARQVMALIFRPGFSTAQRVTVDAGRGAGMDLVRTLVAELGGRVGLASASGRFSKFKIWLPATERAAAA